jgi:RNA polymerase sigma-70 factor (ECF subfamily)
VASETSAITTAELRQRHELRRRLNGAQQRSLADLYRSNASAVYFVCHFLLRNPEDAADATQEVFLKAVERLGGRSTTEPMRSWLLTAAQNHCLEVLRRHHRVSTIAGTDSGGDADPETAVVERDLISAVFRELRVRERKALWQWAVESRPLAEIANDLGLSYTAVQQLVFRARRHAASVAARVAALLGLLQLGRALRRVSQAYQVALAAAVVPVVLVSSLSSSGAPTLPSPRGGGTMVASPRGGGTMTASPEGGGTTAASHRGGGTIAVVGGTEIGTPTLPSPNVGGVIDVNSVRVSVPALSVPAVPVPGVALPQVVPTNGRRDPLELVPPELGIHR